MNGYELLQNELSKQFHPSKVRANMPLIEAVVKILTENPDEKIALDMAQTKEANTEAKIIEYQAKERDLFNDITKLHERRCVLERWAEELSDKDETLKKREEKISKCETPEASDRLRLAYIYMDSVEVTNGYERTAYIKGLAQVMGSERCEE